MGHTPHHPPQNHQPLPAEILLDIARRIPNLPDLATFARCCTLTHTLASPRLWDLDTDPLRTGKPALYHAIETNNLPLAAKALAKYDELDAHGLLDGTAVPFDTFAWRDGESSPASPVMLAVRSGSMAMLRLVATHPAGCNLDMRCRMAPDGGPCGWGVHESCDPQFCRGCVVGVDHVDGSGDVDWEDTPASCETALHWAARRGRVDMLRFLVVERGATVSLGGDPWDCTVPLRECVVACAESEGSVYGEMMDILDEY